MIGEHGVVAAGLPKLPAGALTALVLNNYLVIREGPPRRIGLGSRSRAIAAKWGISLPPEEDNAGGTAA